MAAALLASAAGASEPLTRSRYLMGTLCEITAAGPRASAGITAAFDEIARLEDVMSTFRPHSELSLVNARGGSPALSKDLGAVLGLSLEIALRSSGAFDPTYASPEPARGFKKVRLSPDRKTLRLAPGAVLNLGAVGKGYALDAAAAALRRAGVASALLNFGGQVYALGSAPGQEGWPVLLPPSTTLLLKDASVSTSGDSERPGHIVDPRTGRPLRGAAVSVVLPQAADADAWSTAFYVQGREAAFPGFSGCVLFTSPAASAGDCSRFVVEPIPHPGEPS